MYTLYKFHFLNGITEINTLFDDILIIWPAPVCEGPIDAKACLGILERHMLSPRWQLHLYFSRTMPGLILHVASFEYCACAWLACPRAKRTLGTLGTCPLCPRQFITKVNANFVTTHIVKVHGFKNPKKHAHQHQLQPICFKWAWYACHSCCAFNVITDACAIGKQM